MSFDIDYHFGAVERSVKSLEVEGKAAKAVSLVRHYSTSIDDLWEALTSADRIQSWFLPISGDLKLGGRYQFEGNAGGEIKQCQPPNFLSVTWEWQDDVSWVELKLDIIDEASNKLTLIHTALVSDFWTEYGPGATGVGWELGLVGLDQHVIDANAAKMDEEEFSLSSEGKLFMAKSSDDWGKASIAAGTETAEAVAAAKRTTAFYTGEPLEEF